MSSLQLTPKFFLDDCVSCRHRCSATGAHSALYASSAQVRALGDGIHGVRP